MKLYERFHQQETPTVTLILRALASAVSTQTQTIRRHVPNRLIVMPLAAAYLVFAAAGLRAEPPLAPATLGTVLTVSNAAETQDLPATAWHPVCNIFLVVWQDRRNGVDDDIWGRYVNGAGEALSSGEFNLTPGRAGNQRAPAVAYHEGHGFFVVWMDDQAGNWDVYGRYFDCAKTPATVLIPIATTPEPQQYPDVVARYNEAWVVWQDQRNGNWDIYGQRVTFPLPPVDPNVFISNQAADQSYPAIAANPNDNGCTLQSFLVTWRDSRNSATTNLDIYDQQLSDIGPCGPNQTAYRELRSQSFPDLDYGTTDNRYLVFWQDDRAGATAVDIYGRRMWPNGLPDGAAFPISTAARNQLLPATVYNGGNNEFLVVWQDFRNGVSWDIGAQRVSGAGALQDFNFPIAATAGDELNPAVAYGGTAGHYLVVWSQGGNIFARACWS